MKTTLSVLAALSLTAMSAMADSKVFRGIVGDAANIQRDAQAISQHLKAKNADHAAVKAKIEELGKDIATLRKDIAEFESTHPNLTPAQKKDWEAVKMKAEMLTIFYDRKAEMMNSGEMAKNRSMIRAHADGIAKRAELLQQTASRLDR